MAKARIIDGRALATGLRQRVAEAAAQLREEHLITPGLAAVLVGDDPASQVYVRSKARACAAAGLASFGHRLTADAGVAAILALVAQLNDDERVDGILLAAPQMEDDQALAHVLDRTLPVVSLNHIAGATVTTVGPDDEQAGELPTRHLVELGHRAIAVVGGVRGRRLTQSRLRGYRRALEDAGIEFSADLVAEGGDSVAGGLEALPRLLERRSDVTAVICHHDLVAVGVLAGLRKLGRRVPDDCSVTGCDDLNSAAYTTPPLTSVHVPFYEIGAEAMRSLLKMITSGANRAPDVTLPVRLVKRASTGPAA